MAELNNPFSVWESFDLTKYYVADYLNNVIRVIDKASGIISRLAGSGVDGYSGDGGKATNAALSQPLYVIDDTNGNVYFSDNLNHRVRKIDSNSIITTVAGGGNSDDATTAGTQADIYLPMGLSFDTNSFLYICDAGRNVVRRLDLTSGILTVFAGKIDKTGQSGDNGEATKAKLDFPSAIWLSTTGEAFIADRDNDVIRRVDAAGIISTFAGMKDDAGFSGDGSPALDARLSYQVNGVAGDSNGNLYISDSQNNRLRMVDTAGIISTKAGTGLTADNGDKSALDTNLYRPAGIFVSADAGLFLIAEQGRHRIRAIRCPVYVPTAAPTTAPSAGPTYAPTSTCPVPDSYVYCVAGTGEQGDKNCNACEATLDTPYSIFISNCTGDVYIAENKNHVVRVIRSATGKTEVFAGTGEKGYSGDGGPAVDAQLEHPRAVVEDKYCNVYIADSCNDRIRVVNVNGTITTYAGGGHYGASGLTAATNAVLQQPIGMFIFDDHLYFAESLGHVIRRVSLESGLMEVVVGQLNDAGFVNDVVATDAKINFPFGVYLDSTGVMYLTERDNFVVRKVTTDGIIRSFAGTAGVEGYSGDGGPATSAVFSKRLRGVWGDSLGGVFVADANNMRIRRVECRGLIDTVVGTGSAGFNGNGLLATSTNIRIPTGLFVSSGGDLYFTEGAGHRVRVATYDQRAE